MICAYITINLYLINVILGMFKTFKNWESTAWAHGSAYPFGLLVVDILLIWIGIQALIDVSRIHVTFG